LQKDSDVWCPDVYKNIFIDRVNDDRLRIAPCCQADQAIEPVENFDFSSSNYLVQIRQEFEQNRFAKACHRCQHDESVNKLSRRQSVMQRYDKADRHTQLESIDFSSTWACNLACVMCNEQYSSTWARELNIDEQSLYKLGRRIHRSQTFLDRLDLKTVKRIHINGGEPLINDDHLLILRRLQELGRLGEISVSYNTNGTQRPSAEAIELWRQCRLIKLYFSIDGTQQSYEYVRWPAKWLQTVQNLLELRDTLPSNVMFGFNVTVAAYNIFEIADVLDWFKYNYSTNREQDPSDFVYQTAKNFDPIFLCEPAKQAAIKRLEQIDEFQGIVTDLKNHINYCASDEWCERLDKIDQRRGMNWRQVLQVGKYY
jgi:hypothetical protein